MGKLGGQELNYSSDVDVLFVYSEEGQVFKEPPGKGKPARAMMTNHQFFNRLAEAFIAEVSRMTPEGMLFRIDLRLRPEGDSGPLCRSLGELRKLLRAMGPDLGAHDVDQGAPRGRRARRWPRNSWK